jgi:hypothetical protein
VTKPSGGVEAGRALFAARHARADRQAQTPGLDRGRAIWQAQHGSDEAKRAARARLDELAAATAGDDE